MNNIYWVNRAKYVSPDDSITCHFKAKELADPLEQIIYINEDFLEDFVVPLRIAVRRPFVVNSACRSIATNRRVKGHPRSLHLMYNPYHGYTGGSLALDISSRGWSKDVKHEFAKQARALDLSLGIHDQFFHIDARVLIGMPRLDFHY